jgi:hypothetical protein
VHHEDIRRPLGQLRQVPEERLVASLEVAPALSGFVGSKSRSGGAPPGGHRRGMESRRGARGPRSG